MRGQQPGGHVDPLDVASEHQELPALVPAHGRVGHSGDHRAAVAYPAEERRARPAPRSVDVRPRSPCHVVFSVSHMSADTVSRAPRAFSRAAASAPSTDDGYWRSRPSRSITPGRLAIASSAGGYAHHGQQRAAGALLVGPRVLRACAAGARRGCGRCPRPARRSARSRTATRRCGSACAPPPLLLLLLLLTCHRVASGPGSGARCGGHAGWRRPARCGISSVARRRSASTQVSLEPPPWLELTTSSPSGSATRVRPPGSTQTLLPSLTANGRRSHVARREACRRSASAPSRA